MSKIDDLTRLKYIRDSAQEALSFVKNRTREDLDNERMLSLALVKLIEIMGEAANNVSESSQTKYFYISSHAKLITRPIELKPLQGNDRHV
jgi:uncharacterized protein with HEPN domain